jgi:hypothetical protein
MRAVVLVWRAPHLFVVVRCMLCGADIWTRWPERWRGCDACGEERHVIPSPRAR